MKKLKTISKYKIIFLLVLIISFLFTNCYQYKSKFTGKEKNIKGYVIDKYHKNDFYIIIIKSKEKILVKSNEKTNVKLNDFISIYGKLTKPNKNTVFNTFNYKKYLYNKKIYYIMNSKKIRIIKKNRNILFKIKNKIEDRINNYKSKDYLKVFVLGNKNEINNETKKIYQNIGIIHLLSISGSYITILIMILNK